MLGHKTRPAILVIALVLGVVLFIVISNGKPASKPAPDLPVQIPAVEVLLVHPARQRLSIDSQGVIEPAIKTTLVAQVSGRVEEVSGQFASGGSFSADSKLVQIESADYEIALSQAKADLADAKRALAIEKGTARQARREWRELGSEEANALFLRKPQLASAEARVRAAEAGLRKAQLELQRTGISAPFDGIVLEKAVDIGQFVAAGTRLGEVFSVARAEVRLPVSTLERSRMGEVLGTPVELYSDDLGEQGSWQASVQRIEAAVDTASRQYYLVASIDRPFQASQGEGGSTQLPLTVGQFVQARIEGREIDNVLRIPRAALRQPSQLWLLDEEDKLRIVDVEILQRNVTEAIVQLDAAELSLASEQGSLRVVVSSLSLALSGMQTRVKGSTHPIDLTAAAPEGREPPT